MKNKIAGLLIAWFLGLLFMVSKVQANEGEIKLVATSGNVGSCYATSVYIDGGYRVLMTCRDLKMAFDPVRNNYVVWAVKGENRRRLGEILKGKMQTSIDEDFERLEITAENDGYITKPEGEVLLSGIVVGFDLDKEIVKPTEVLEQEKVVPAASEQKQNDLGLEKTVTAQEETPGGSLASAFKVILKAGLVGFGVLIAIVGVLSYTSRRKQLS